MTVVFATTAIAAASASAEGFKKSWKTFANCPVLAENPEWDASEGKAFYCIYAQTETLTGGQYKVGNITVPLTKPVKLQFGTGLYFDPKSEAGNGVEEAYAPPTGGLEGITPVAENVPGEPIANISTAEQEEMGWPETLRRKYAEGQKKHTVKKVAETIELVGAPHVNKANILRLHGPGIIVPVRIKGENKWLSQLGDVCYIGTEAEPVVQRLTSGSSTSPLTEETITGANLGIEFFQEFGIVGIHSELVDNTYAVPGATCTGPYSSYIEAAIDKVFGVPAVAGASKTELKGYLYQSIVEEAIEHI